MIRKRLLLFVSIAGALLSFHVCQAYNLVANGSFETPIDTSMLPPPIQYPSEYAYWTGDAVMTVGHTAGIAPLDGAQMLSFLFTESALYPYSGGIQSTLCQLVDITPYADAILAGDAVAQMSCAFNRVAGDAQTDTEFKIQVYAFAGDHHTLHEQLTTGNELAEVTQSILTDADPASWEVVSTELPLPSETDFVAVLIHARENIFDDSGPGEFDGHFADVVVLEIVPEPATFLLLGFGGMVLLRRRNPL